MGKTTKQISTSALWVGMGVALAMLTGQAIGQKTAKTDFSKAFENLRSLGLPDNQKGKYVLISMGGQETASYGSGMYSPFANDLYSLQLKGNAWLIGEDPKKKTFSLILFNREKKTFSTETDSTDPPYATWKKADAKADLAMLTKAFEPDGQIQNRLDYSQSLAGNLILAAAQYHRFGLKKEANELASLTLTKVPDKNAAITGSISLLATQEYTAALQKIASTHDWNAFADSCTSIIGKYGRGWDAAAGVQVLIEKLRKQAVPPPPLQAPAGISLTDEDQQIMSEISAIKKSPLVLESLASYPDYSPWIFLEEKKMEELFSMFSNSKNDGDQIVKKIISRGMDSLPMLLAMLGDDSLLPYSLELSSSPKLGDIDRIFAKLNNRQGVSLPLPASRAKFATPLIASLVPGMELYNARQDDVLGAAMGWYESTRNQSLNQIARKMLREGNSNQMGGAITYLSTHGKEEDFAIIEDTLIDNVIESPWEGFEKISGYLEHRGDAGTPFMQRLEDELQRQLATMKDDPELKSEYTRTKENYDAQLKTLRSLLSDESAGDMLARIVSGEEKLEEAQQAFFKKLKKEKFSAQITILLKGIMDSDDPQLRNNLLSFFSYLPVDKKTKPNPTEHAESWGKLLADTRNSDAGNRNGNEVRLTAAWAIESLYAPETVRKLQLFWNRAGKMALPLLIERASARIEGKTGDEIPAYADPDDVPEERRTSLASELLALAAKPDEFRLRLDQLSLSEKLWATGERRKPDDESQKIPPLQKALSQLQNTFAEVQAPDGWSSLASWPGQIFSLEKFDQLIEQSLSHVEKGQTFQIKIKAAGPFGPLKLSIEAITMEKLSEKDSPTASAIQQVQRFAGKKATPILAGSMNNTYYSGFWVAGDDSDDDETTNENADPFGDPSSMGGARNILKEQAKAYRNRLRYWFQASMAMATPLDLTFFGAAIEPKSANPDKPDE